MIWKCKSYLGDPADAGPTALLRSATHHRDGTRLGSPGEAVEECYARTIRFLRDEADFIGPEGNYDTAEDAMEHVHFIVSQT